MAAPQLNMLPAKVGYFLAILSLYLKQLGAETQLHWFQPSELQTRLETSCALALDSSNNVATDDVDTFLALQSIFEDEDAVAITTLDAAHFTWPGGASLELASGGPATDCKVLFFPRTVVDRTCLLTPAHSLQPPKATVYTGPLSIDALVSFINDQCGTFRNDRGGLTVAGLHRKEILHSLYRLESITDVSMGKLYRSCSGNPFKAVARWRGVKEKVQNVLEESRQQCYAGGENCEKQADSNNKYTGKELEDWGDGPKMAQCDRVELSALTGNVFFHDYVKRSRPVIINNAASGWPAFAKWTREFFRGNFGEKKVHVKLTPGGDFEGIEKADLWEDYSTFQIPEEVQRHLPYPDLVVVRPAGHNMKFSEFLDLIEYAASQPDRNVSAYLEYSSIPQYMPQIEEDLVELPFAKSLLTRRHLNMWLSDGNTVGRLHFDAFDNLLIQLRGQKQAILFEPFDNTKMYEAHIQQATLSYSKNGHKFRRKQLEDSTSMVMSPVDILDPDFERFPRFAESIPLNCTIGEGDALYMPSFWWHEVYSFPNAEEKRNLAVNYWYEPFLRKEFPCSECPLDVNPHYQHLL